LTQNKEGGDEERERERERMILSKIPTVTPRDFREARYNLAGPGVATNQPDHAGPERGQRLPRARERDRW